MAGGGEAFLCTAEFLNQPTTEDLEERFRRPCAAAYEELSAQARELLRQSRGASSRGPAAGDLASRASRLQRRLGEVTALDFFAAPGRAEAEALLLQLATRLQAGRAAAPAAGAAGRQRLAELTGRTWVTRKGVHVDRIASAWLIRRCIDPTARFRFADSQTPEAAPGELRFDTMGGDFTHDGDRCTFETLVARLELRDSALFQIAEIVHDIDLKDAKFGRAEAPGILQLVNGLALSHPDDLDRLDRGFALFDDLHESFRRRLPAGGAARGDAATRFRPRLAATDLGTDRGQRRAAAPPRKPRRRE